jgi:Ca2+-binding RTX toxin-like protein
MPAGIVAALALGATTATAPAQQAPPPFPVGCPAQAGPGFSFTSMYLAAAWDVNEQGTDADDLMLAGAGMKATIDGKGGNDVICSFGPSNDTIYGGPGNDHIIAGPGDDIVYGGPGDDTIDCGDGNDHAYGGGGNDTFIGCEKVD